MYEIIAFDGLQLPIYLQRGDEQNLGTGSAQTEFRQLPGGGFYRMRRGRRSPQGIRPVSKSCVIWGDTAAEVRAQLDAWRSKIGVYGKLSVRFFDGSLRWQWAELQDVDAPVAASVKGNYVPLSLVWQTAAQNWNGIIHGPAWTWGDGSWEFGDGTASFGQNELTFTLPAATSYAANAANAGNIDATNLLVQHTAAGSRTNWTLRSITTGQEIRYTGTLLTGHTVRIDTAAQRAHKLGAAVAITTITRDLNTLTVTTAAAHGLVDGNSVEIGGNAKYDGLYTNIDVTGSTTFTVTISPDVYAYGAAGSGTVRLLTDIYPNLTINDEQRWMVLRPGDNDLRVSSVSTMTGDTLEIDYYDHYA